MLTLFNILAALSIFWMLFLMYARYLKSNPIDILRMQFSYTDDYTTGPVSAWFKETTETEEAPVTPDSTLHDIPNDDALPDDPLGMGLTAEQVDAWISDLEISLIAEPKKYIDVVYLYVNGSEQRHFDMRMKYMAKSPAFASQDGFDHVKSRVLSSTWNRFREHGELRYSLRSVEQNMGPFVNRVTIVTTDFEPTVTGPGKLVFGSGQIPQWLSNPRSPDSRVRVVHHSEVFKPAHGRESADIQLDCDRKCSWRH